MVRSLRVLSSLVLLFALTGAPLASVLCAEWCAPTAHTTGGAAHHGTIEAAAGPTPALPAGASDCHGRSHGDGPRVAAHAARECLDGALSGTDSGPITPRVQVAPLMSVASAMVLATSYPMPRLVALGRDVVHGPPLRPLAASPVLRI